MAVNLITAVGLRFGSLEKKSTVYSRDHMTRKDVKGDQPSGGETTWTNTGATRYGRGQHKRG